MAFADCKDWEKEAARQVVLELLSQKSMSPREMCDVNKTGLYFSNDEIGELIQDSIDRGVIRLAGFKVSYLDQLKPGPSGILEAFFEVVR